MVIGIVRCLPFGSSTNQQDVISQNDSVHLVRIDSTQENFKSLFAAPTTYGFYQLRNYQALWLKNSKKTLLADSMIHFIRSARMYGLLPQDYHLEEIETLIDTVHTCVNSHCIDRLEILLTNAFFSMASHIKQGRIESTTLQKIARQPRTDTVQIQLLNEVLQTNTLTKAFVSLEPEYKAYKKLRYALQQILLTADSAERCTLLSGEASDSSEVSLKVISIEVSMERWRWESRLKGRYISVNIPGFMLDLVEGDSTILESKIIVGTSKNQTPMLDGLVRSFTIFPYWNVTRNIAVKEILPRLQTDSLYLQQHHYDVLNIEGKVLDASTINWKDYHENNFPVMLRQREGTHNSLGIIKFSFANKFSVYLHDTNARMLFKREKRALSHGCVRVEKALELGRYLVRDDSVYCSPEDLDQYLELKKQLTIRVVNPIPVHFRYFTCDIRNDAVKFYKDIYNLDAPLMQAIYTPPVLTNQKLMLVAKTDSTVFVQTRLITVGGK